MSEQVHGLLYGHSQSMLARPEINGIAMPIYLDL
jgi:hypothetical protein